MSFFKKALCAAAVGGLALSSPAMAAPKVAAVKVATKDVRAGSKIKKAERAVSAEVVVIGLIGTGAAIAGIVAATKSTSP